MTKMSRKNPYEACSRCETFHLHSELTSVPARDANGQIVYLRLCRACLHPRITYIQGGPIPTLMFDLPHVLMAGLAATLVILNVIFGLIIGGSAGFAVMLSATLVGAGFLALVAASCILSS